MSNGLSPGLPYPHCSHVKDILRLTLAVHTIALMIICAVAVREGMTVLSVKNRLGSRATRDILMIVQLPCGKPPPQKSHHRLIFRAFQDFVEITCSHPGAHLHMERCF